MILTVWVFISGYVSFKLSVDVDNDSILGSVHRYVARNYEVIYICVIW